MLDWLKKNWLTLTLGVGAGAVGFAIYEKHAAAALPPAPATPVTVPVNLQPGETTVAVKPNGVVVLILPQGAIWSTSLQPVTPLVAGAGQPSGNISQGVQFNASGGVITANWVDQAGVAQRTIVHVAIGA